MARYRLSKRGYMDADRPKLAFIRIACEIPLRTRLVAIAEKRQLSLSEVVREACREYVENNRG